MPVTVCPSCTSPMSEVSRRGVYVDVCPSCRGVWLDGGELEKLLSTADAGAAEAPREPRYQTRDAYRQDHGGRGWTKDQRGKKRENNIFEMFGDLFE